MTDDHFSFLWRHYEHWQMEEPGCALRPDDGGAAARAGGADGRGAFAYFRRGGGDGALRAVCAGVWRRDGGLCLHGKAEDGHAPVCGRLCAADDAGAREHAGLYHGGLQLVFERLAGYLPSGRIQDAGGECGRL